MMRLKVLNVRDVAEAQLCTGCGVCAYTSGGQIEMVDTLEHGRRPVLRAGAEQAAQEAMAACPGLGQERRVAVGGEMTELMEDWGPVLEIWEGYAVDEQLRHRGSSGGVISAIATYCVERGAMAGVLHVAARSDVPYLNQTVLSCTREEILSAAGSRYAPASPCEKLELVENASAPCVFVGKPCDVVGAVAAARLKPRLSGRLGLTISIFCAGTPTLKGTFELMRHLGVENPDDTAEIRYRGNGWPGMMSVRVKGGKPGEERQTTYSEGWGKILQKHRQWRCHVCADHTGEHADLSVGDPWYRPTGEGDPGRSLLIVRTERGRSMVRAAMAAGYVRLERVGGETLPAAQEHLLRVRSSLWGRLVACRLMGAAAPKYQGMAIFRSWRRNLGFSAKISTILGAARRVLRRGLRRRSPVRPWPDSVTAKESSGCAT